MSILKEKSTFNFDAANLLQENSLYAPSVHCSYYGCLQLIKVVINDFIGITYEEIDIDIRELKEESHKYLITKVSNAIREYSSIEHAFFNRNIKELKTFRLKSDYQNIEITSDKSDTAMKIATEVRKQLITIFNV